MRIEQYPKPEVVHVSRAPFFRMNGTGYRLDGGGVQTSMALATANISDAMVSVQNHGNTNRHSWNSQILDKRDISDLELDTEDTISHQLEEHHLNNEAFEEYRRNSIIWWWIHHGMTDQLKTDVETLNLKETFIKDYVQYRRVNTRTAHDMPENLLRSPVMIVHDPYYLSRMTHILRESQELKYEGNLVAVNHIPFPRPEDFHMLSILGLSKNNQQVLTRQYIQGWMGADTISFHTQQDADNFKECVHLFLGPNVNVPELLVNPLGVDTEHIRNVVESITDEERSSLDEMILRNAPNLSSTAEMEGLIIGANIGTRADPIKKIPQTFEDIELLLETNPEMLGKFTYVQQVRPHRGEFPSYAKELDRIKELAAKINEKYGRPGYQPIVLIAEEFKQRQVFGMYNQLARTAGENGKFFVTALGHEGMSLSVQEGHIAGTVDKPDTTMIVSDQVGMGGTLKQRRIRGVMEGDFIKGSFANMVYSLEKTPKEILVDLNQQISAVLEDINLHSWTGRLLHRATNGTISNGHR